MSYYNSYEKEHRDQEEYERIKANRGLLEAYTTKQKEGVVVERSEEIETTEPLNTTKIKVATIELDYTITRHQTTCLEQRRTTETLSLYDDHSLMRQRSDDDVFEEGRDTALSHCQLALDLVSSSQRGLAMRGEFSVTLEYTGHTQRYRLKLGARCERIDYDVK